MVAVACADRNYLFGLPPMLDGLPTPGKSTAPWLAKYGESLKGVRAGPWPGCVFRGEVVYVHALDGVPKVPAIPAKLVSKKLLTATHAKPDTILKLQYDRSVEEFALAAPSLGSLTAGKVVANGEVDLGREATFDRVEFTVDASRHRRGDGRDFELEVEQPDGSWHTVHRGRLFGSIYAKVFEPVAARRVRLRISGATLKQFDLFPPGK